MNIDGVELPELTAINPTTKLPYAMGDTAFGSDGKVYMNNGMTWLLQDNSQQQPLPQTGIVPTGTTNQPNVLFTGKTTYDPGTGQTAPGVEEKSWVSALDFMAGLRGKKDKAEYNRYAEALKNSPFWSGGKKISASAVDAAWKKALYSSSANAMTIQSLLFDKDMQSVAADNASPTSKYNNINYYTNVINRTSAQKRIELTPEQVKSLASQAMSNSWDMATLQENIARTGKIDFTAGDAASNIIALKQWAADNGMPFDDSWYQTAATNILEGKSTLEIEKQTISNYAKGLYSAEPLVKGMDAGFSIRQQASPYINYLAKIRGVDPTSISLDEPILKKNLTKRDDKGNPTVASYYDFTLDVRQNDPLWGYSKEAEDETTSMLSAFGRMFGKSV